MEMGSPAPCSRPLTCQMAVADSQRGETKGSIVLYGQPFLLGPASMNNAWLQRHQPVWMVERPHSRLCSAYLSLPLFTSRTHARSDPGRTHFMCVKPVTIVTRSEVPHGTAAEQASLMLKWPVSRCPGKRDQARLFLCLVSSALLLSMLLRQELKAREKPRAFLETTVARAGGEQAYSLHPRHILRPRNKAHVGVNESLSFPI